MSVPLQSVPGNSENEPDSTDEAIAQAKHEAAEIIARAHRQAESIIADARADSSPAPNPLAALGDNAEEIIGQVRKLIKKQREMQAERQGLLDEIEGLKAERDELVQRLTDAVERMEELSQMAAAAQGGSPSPVPSPPVQPPEAPAQPPPAAAPPAPSDDDGDTSLAARLRKAEQEEAAATAHEEDSSLAARLERAERDRSAEADEDFEQGPPRMAMSGKEGELGRGADGRSFYDRHSAKLPRLEGDGGRSVLSAIGDMRPESEPKGRKGRRRKGNK